MKVLQVVMCLVALAGPGYTQLVRYSFNFLDGPSTRVETLDASGIVRGTFNYLDSQGNLKAQYYDYTAQVGSPAVNFFEPAQTPTDLAPLQRAESTQEHTDGDVETTPVIPEPIHEEAEHSPEASEPEQDIPEVTTETPEFTTSTPEVTTTTPQPTTTPSKPEPTESPDDVLKIDFKKFGQRLRALARFSPVPSHAAHHASRTKRAVVIPSPFTYVAPHRFHAFSAPFTYSHPAVAYSAAFPPVATYSGIPVAAPAAGHDSILLQVVHNPSHSVSYRVD